jgi:hypothetical protein
VAAVKHPQAEWMSRLYHPGARPLISTCWHANRRSLPEPEHTHTHAHAHARGREAEKVGGRERAHARQPLSSFIYTK